MLKTTRLLHFAANQLQNYASKRTMASLGNYNFETLLVTQPVENVFEVKLNRPEKLNSMNKKFWHEMVDCFDAIGEDENCRAVVVSGEGRVFTAGLDLTDTSLMQAIAGGPPATDEDDDDDDDANGLDSGRRAFKIRKIIAQFQETFTAIERCPKPVVAAIHSACIGGGVDLVTACDIRYCTQDAFFQIKEVDIGLAADVGTLQRLPKIVGNDSLVRELSYTARRMMADEALQMGLVSKVCPDKEALLAAALEVAKTIAEKSPIAVQGTKMNLIYSRDHSVASGLHYMQTWNAAMLQSDDLMKAAVASMTKEKPLFAKL